MKNIINADVYRIVRGKGLYITFGVLIALILLIIGADAMVRDMADSDFFAGMFIPATPEGLPHSFTMLFGSAGNNIFIILPLVVIAAAPMFSSGAVKNDIAAGLPRTKLYVSKLIICAVLCVLMQLFYMVVGVLMFLGFGGGVGTMPDGFWLEVLQSYGAQLFMFLAVMCIGVFFVFTTKRSGVVIGAYIAFFLVPDLIITIFIFVDYDLAVTISRFDLSTSFARLGMGFTGSLETHEIVTTFAIGAGFMLAACIGGIALFKRAEIK